MSNLDHHAIIIGAGIAGLASAIALTTRNSIRVSIFEIKASPFTIGGAINLTPNALRYLDYLGVLPKLAGKGCDVKKIDLIAHRTGKSLGNVNFDNLERFKYRALRVMRNELHGVMLERAREVGVDVQFGMRIESVIETDDGIVATFEDGTKAAGTFVLGCDGIHSAVRMKFVEPNRKPVYTGISNAYGFLDIDGLQDQLPVESTTLFSGRFGSLLMSYTDQDRQRLYVSAVAGAEDVGSREGWVAKGKDQVAIKQDLLRRFKGPTIPCLSQVLEKVDDIVLYPVYKLSENGKWTTGRILLLGDAAHAMPPQGESVGLALEDVVLFSRILNQRKDVSIEESMQKYVDLRRDRINAAVKSANFGFETIKDHGWLMTILIEWMTWIYLLMRAGKKEEEYAFDVGNIDLENM